ncbi:helix-turn-helix domain-containing protein [Streptomyces sp. 8N616]|uniref:helix-turn-helix domain-containing protein n=1 Tax=Streptomyces sp. 8N616 TaxID=3457414 RepID=UPI003FD2001B
MNVNDENRSPSAGGTGSLSPEWMAGEMRRLKKASGLSFEKLAARTHYSRSSWERFVNGKKPVTAQAVHQFASALGGAADELLRLSARTGPEPGSRLPVPVPAEREVQRPHAGEGVGDRFAQLGLFAVGAALGSFTVLWVKRRAGRGVSRPVDAARVLQVVHIPLPLPALSPLFPLPVPLEPAVPRPR